MRSAVTYILLGALAYSCSASGEFDVNIRSSLNQANPAIAADSNGNFVVVWHSYYQSKSNEIRARLFEKDGSAVSGELVINQTERGQSKGSCGSDGWGGKLHGCLAGAWRGWE